MKHTAESYGVNQVFAMCTLGFYRQSKWSGNVVSCENINDVFLNAVK